MKIQHDQASRVTRLSVLFILIFSLGIYTTPGAETIAELEKKSEECRRAIAWADLMYRSYSCEAILKPDWIRYYVEQRTSTARRVTSLEGQLESLDRLIPSLEVQCNNDLRSGGPSSASCATLQARETDRNRVLVEYKKATDKQKDDDANYLMARKNVEDCAALRKQIAQGEINCRGIDQQLATARANLQQQQQQQRQQQQQQQQQTTLQLRGPATAYEGQNITFTAELPQNISANLLNVQYTGGYSWLMDGRPLPGTNSSVTFVAPAKGVHSISAQFWIRRGQSPSTQVLSQGGVPFTVQATTQSARTIRIGWNNYQKIPGFSVTVNGVTKSCSPGQGDCTFEVPAGPCSVSVQAPGYKTESFQQTYDKDQTAMTTLSKAQ